MRCRGVQGIANSAYLEGFPFPALLRVAPYCVRGGVRVVSGGPGAVSYFSGSGKPHLAVDLSPLLLSFRGCGNRSPPSAPYPRAPSPPHGDAERAPPGPKPYEVLKAVGSVRKVVSGVFSENRSPHGSRNPTTFNLWTNDKQLSPE
jgi:hypothetical protein